MPKKHENLDFLFDRGLDLEKRRVFLHGDLETSSSLREYFEGSVSDSPVENVVRSLLYLDNSSGDIELWINSPGGLLYEMFGLYDIIQSLTNTVRTIGFGSICSAAGLILACGDQRVAFPNSSFMSHSGSGEIVGNFYELTNSKNQLEVVENRWATLMAKHTKHSKKWWKDLHKGEIRELWLDAKQMVRHGIVDSIWTG